MTLWLAMFIAQHYSRAIIIITVQHYTIAHASWHHAHNYWQTPMKTRMSGTLHPSISRERRSGYLAYSELFCDKILSHPIRFEILNLLLSNALLAAHVHIAGPAWFAVTRDVFCNYCIPREQLTCAPRVK